MNRVKSEPILLIDDDPEVRRTLRAILETDGFSVTDVTSAEMGLERLKEQDFAAALCDFKMPGLSGLGFVKAARKQYPLLPIVIITGYASPEELTLCLQGGADDYLLKPFDGPALLASLERLIGQRQRLAALRHTAPTDAADAAPPENPLEGSW